MCKWIVGREVCSVCGKAPPHAWPGAAHLSKMLAPTATSLLERYWALTAARIPAWDSPREALAGAGFGPDADQAPQDAADLLTQDAPPLEPCPAVGHDGDGSAWTEPRCPQPMDALEKLVCGQPGAPATPTWPAQQMVKGSTLPRGFLLPETVFLFEEGEMPFRVYASCHDQCYGPCNGSCGNDIRITESLWLFLSLFCHCFHYYCYFAIIMMMVMIVLIIIIIIVFFVVSF